MEQMAKNPGRRMQHLRSLASRAFSNVMRLMTQKLEFGTTMAARTWTSNSPVRRGKFSPWVIWLILQMLSRPSIMTLNKKVLRISWEFSAVLTGENGIWTFQERVVIVNILDSQLGIQEGGDLETESDKNCIPVLMWHRFQISKVIFPQITSLSCLRCYCS